MTSGEPMRRREFIGWLAGASAAWPLAARAQQTMPVIGFLNSGSAAAWAHLVAAFKDGLNEAGYVEGRNVAVEYRWTQGDNDRLPGLAADLVRRQVAVIAAFGPPAALAAKAATTTIPIVFMAGTDPIDLGLVTSFRRPTGNVTGFNVFAEVLTPKRQELLHELVPSAPRVAMLVNSAAAQTTSELRDVQAAAVKLGQQVQIFDVSNDREIDAAFAAIVDQRIAGLLVQTDQFFTVRRDQLVLLTTRHAIPTVFGWREFALAGGLISYGTSLRAAYRQIAVYTGRILKGEKPGDLPVQQATTFETVVNLKAAKALGVSIPTSILLRADEVIE
ncbi:MAG: ABC transporter substrate-binding protein [Proteobacteria bacterium]|nr:MAG: ABC transporter substrate-binding protein [Pseudomonadota bacterium]